jgi:hypothetical protein
MRARLASTVVVSSCFLIGGSALAQGPARARISDLAWMAGSWRGEAEGALSEETWAAPEGDAMVGMWRLVADGKTRIFEVLVLREDEEGVALRLRHFDPALVAREEKDKPLVLRLVQWGPREASFEGPSVSGEPGLVRIRYRRPADDTLVAALERPGKPKEEFSFKRRPSGR